MLNKIFRQPLNAILYMAQTRFVSDARIGAKKI